MSTGGLDIGRRAASLRRMQSSSKEDPSHPEKKVVEVHLDTGNIWFRQVEGEPSHEELIAWVEKYQEAASGRFQGDPLIVDVIAEGLRPKSS